MATNGGAAAAKLRLAARLIAEATDLLDTRSSRCPACGRPVFENLAHARTAERLADQPFRLRELAGRVENAERDGARQMTCRCATAAARRDAALEAHHDDDRD